MHHPHIFNCDAAAFVRFSSVSGEEALFNNASEPEEILSIWQSGRLPIDSIGRLEEIELCSYASSFFFVAVCIWFWVHEVCNIIASQREKDVSVRALNEGKMFDLLEVRL